MEALLMTGTFVRKKVLFVFLSFHLFIYRIVELLFIYSSICSGCYFTFQDLNISLLYNKVFIGETVHFNIYFST